MKIYSPNIGALAIGAVILASLCPAFAQSGFWTTNYAPSPDQRGNVAAAAWNGILYVAGGNPPGDTSPVGTFESYNPAKNAWTSLAALPIATEEASATVLNGILYVAGGGSCCGGYGFLQAYNPASNAWTIKSSLQTPQGYGVRTVAVNGLLYAIGGNSGYGTIYPTVEAYNPTNDTWTEKSPVPFPVRYGGVAVVNGIIYYFGGSPGSAPLSKLVAAYNPLTDTWTAKSPLPTPLENFGFGVLNGIIYAFGGTDGTNIVSANYAYNPATDAWSSQTALPAGLECYDSANAADVINGVLYTTSVAANGLVNIAAFTPNSLTINMYAGLTIAGPIGSTYEIESASNLAASNWTTLATLVLSNSPALYIDTNSTYFSRLFYRAVLQ